MTGVQTCALPICQYKIEVPNRKDRSEKGQISWAGIPLQWANALFVGRIPCPETAAMDHASTSVGKKGELIVETGATVGREPEKFIYHFRTFEGVHWAESLHWERKGIADTAPVVVDFRFDDPEAKTHSPKKWEAKGSQGEVKVRWRDRQIEMTR